jgi:hypothetical protein
MISSSRLAAPLRVARPPSLPRHSAWRRTPAAPRSVAPHICRATVSGAAGLELENEDQIHATNQENDQNHKYFELQDLKDVNYLI